ncbi:MAG: histidine--tRNA ligase [marine bacterium B5-7]|nr:MAG: histidine--tRNA ligase [marine bacterium B5-7]
MSKTLQAIRGMNDLVPAQTAVWRVVESRLADIASQFAYQEIRFPIVEQTELFKRAVGESTDIVEKEMYTFTDRNGDSLSLRPEGTAPCVRAGLQQGLIVQQVQRLWYTGPMFRHERPQKGRYRQFYQFGAENFGMPGPLADVELIAMTAQFWQSLGITDAVHLEINSLGTPAVRQQHREALVAYFEQHRDQLDEDSQRRLSTNPLRILDSKNPAMADLIASAPALSDYFDEVSTAHFTQVKQSLDTCGITYRVNPQLVRGLDYYTHTVFEWVTDKLGSQNAICAGGRYDGLVEQIGGKAAPAVGFALGLERLILLLEACDKTPETSAVVDVYWVCVGDAAVQQAMQVAQTLRTAIPTLRLVVDAVGGSFKSQFKRADKSGAAIALILGDDELASQSVQIKYLREDKPQKTILFSELEPCLSRYV